MTDDDLIARIRADWASVPEDELLDFDSLEISPDFSEVWAFVDSGEDSGLAIGDGTHWGGNDALNSLGLLSEPAKSVFDGLHTLADIRDDFRTGYRKMLSHVQSFCLPMAVCTIYDCVPNLGRPEKTALALFNEIILREAFEAKLPVIDLRLVCQEPEDYSAMSPIEPSNIGGEKIAAAIAKLVLAMPVNAEQSVVIG